MPQKREDGDTVKVLLISHNPFSTHNNMGKTFLSLFSHFSKEELCQLYIYPSWPDVDKCASSYRVTDKDMLNRFLRLRSPGGVVPKEKITASQGAYEHDKDRKFYKNRKNKSSARLLLRDCLWKLGGWYTPRLDRWIAQQKPTCIFVATGGSKFIYDMALKISRKWDIPIVTYVCDEYYLAAPPKKLIDRLRLKLLRRKMDQLVSRSRYVAVISEEMQKAYSAHFKAEIVTLMTSASVPVAQQSKRSENPRNLCYFGNIGCNRYRSLQRIGQALDAINRERSTDYKLKIYTAEQNADILSAFSGCGSIELCGFVCGAEFEKAFSEADLLLHTEAFDADSMAFVRHSLSTKIADSLASGIPLFCYGPRGIASVEHLARHDCAILATSEEELESRLLQAFTDPELRRSAAENALAAARQHHDSQTAGMRLKELLKDGML